MRRGVVYPSHAVIVENREVARFIKADQLPYAFLLLRRFRHALRLAQPVDYLLNGRRVHPPHLPHALLQTPVTLDELRVHPHGQLSAPIRRPQIRFEAFRLSLRHAAVVVHRRGEK